MEYLFVDLEAGPQVSATAIDMLCFESLCSFDCALILLLEGSDAYSVAVEELYMAARAWNRCAKQSTFVSGVQR